MDVRQVIDELIAIPEQAAPVASVYLDTRRNDEHQRGQVRIFLHDEARKALKGREEEKDGQRRTLTAITNYGEGLLRQQQDEFATGIALFSCAPIGLFRVVATRTPFAPMQFLWDRRPRIVPFLRAEARMPRLILASIESSGASFFEINAGLVDIEARLDRPFPGWHDMGGWSQLRYQQHIGQIRSRNFEAVAEALVRMADALPDALLVLFGQSIIVSKFEEHLPERMRERIVTRLPSPPSSAAGELRDTLLRAAMKAVEEYLHTRALAVRDVALAEAARNGVGVLGIGEVLLAITEGRLHRLLVDPDFKGTGWSCRACNAVGDTRANACQYCGGQVASVDLLEEAVRRTIRADGEIVFLPFDAKLPENKGLAGVLRHRKTVTTGLGEIRPTGEGG